MLKPENLVANWEYLGLVAIYYQNCGRKEIGVKDPACGDNNGLSVRSKNLQQTLDLYHQVDQKLRAGIAPALCELGAASELSRRKSDQLKAEQHYRELIKNPNGIGSSADDTVAATPGSRQETMAQDAASGTATSAYGLTAPTEVNAALPAPTLKK